MILQEQSNKVLCPRNGESSKDVKFRVSRLFSVETRWYFSTREGVDKGPFNSRKQAENEINKFIREIGFSLICNENTIN